MFWVRAAAMVGFAVLVMPPARAGVRYDHQRDSAHARRLCATVRPVPWPRRADDHRGQRCRSDEQLPPMPADVRGRVIVKVRGGDRGAMTA